MNQKKTTKDKSKREEILEKATQLFYESGYEQTTIRKIAKAVGLDGSSIYNYFRSKEDIANTIEINAWNDYHKAFESLHTIGTAEKRIEEYIRKWIEQEIFSKPMVFLFDNLIPERYLKNLTSHKRDVYCSVRKELVDVSKSKGLEDSIKPTIATLLMLGAISQIHRWYNPEGRIKPEELIDQAIDIFFHGIFGKKSPVTEKKNP